MQLDKIYCKSCLNMSEIDDKSVDMVLTDPPWFISQEIKIHRSMNPKKYKYIGKDISLAGSGATLKAAKRQGRHYIGYENNPHYYKVIKNGLEVEKTLWDITKEKEKIIEKAINNKLDSGVLL